MTRCKQCNANLTIRAKADWLGNGLIRVRCINCGREYVGPMDDWMHLPVVKYVLDMRRTMREEEDDDDYERE